MIDLPFSSATGRRAPVTCGASRTIVRRPPRTRGLGSCCTSVSQDEDGVVATELGNVLAAVESYGRTRYGIDLVLVWPRLYKMLPEQVAASVAAAKAEIELQLVTTALGIAFGIGIAIPLALLHSSVALLCGWLWGCIAVACLGYRSAVAS